MEVRVRMMGGLVRLWGVPKTKWGVKKIITKTGLLTTQHPTSSYNQPVLVVGGQAYGIGDTIDGEVMLVAVDNREVKRVAINEGVLPNKVRALVNEWNQSVINKWWARDEEYGGYKYVRPRSDGTKEK